jgi:hypothetical protein
MTRRVAGLLLAGVLFTAGGPALAHHSFAMFDRDNPVELEGIVQEFKFSNPHTFILLEAKQEDGSTKVWNLEGMSPSGLVREGWSSRTLKAGDELKLIIFPLRSGAPGGTWLIDKINFRDGRPLIEAP